MASGPYQSNLLRFLVGQYHQGINRHRQAVRKTRTQAELGVQVGAVVVLSSIRKVAQVSQALGRGLAGSVTWLGLGALKDDATAKLLNFSGFDESALSESALSEIERTECEVGEAVMVRSLMVVGNCLRADQVSALTSRRFSIWQKATWQKAIRQKAIGLRWSFPQLSFSQLWRKEPDVGGAVVDQTTDLQVGLSGQITGLASDVKARSLQLVIDYRQVWDGLSAQQQSELQRKIWALLGAIANIPRASTSLAPLLKPVLKPDAPRLLQKEKIQNEGLQKEDSSSQLVPQNPVQPVSMSPGQLIRAVLSSPILQTLKIGESPALTTAGYVGKSASTFWEVDVVSVDYVEHPLEKLLKWVDRGLLWVEKLWQRIRNWQVSGE